MPAGRRVKVEGPTLVSALIGEGEPPLPEALLLLSRRSTSQGVEWSVDRAPMANQLPRLEALVCHLDELQRRAGDTTQWWTLACLADGWREDEPAGTTAPAGSTTPWDGPDSVLCFGRRSGDRSGVLVAEPHYFMYGRYARLKAKVRLLRLPWALRRRSAVYAGGDHGRLMQLPGGGLGTPRRLLAKVVADERLPVRVVLGRGVSVPDQLRHRIILDVDGHARTWEAWAWKLLSGSVVISQSSDWQTRFTTEFEAGVHYLQVREDFADLGEALRWCSAHWPQAREMGRAARIRARAVYRDDWVESANEWRRISVALRRLESTPSDTQRG